MIRTFSVLTATLLSAACALSTAPDEEILTLEVAAETRSCVGEAQQVCLQVREPGATEWELFYDSIEGFTHEEGVRYLLEVARRTVVNPPADGSSYAWRLVRVIERDEVGSVHGRAARAVGGRCDSTLPCGPRER